MYRSTSGAPVDLRHPQQHFTQVFAPERTEEIRVQRVRVRQLLVDQSPEEREILEILGGDLLDAPPSLPEVIAEHVDEDRLQPRSTGGLVLKAAIRSVPLQERLLHEILRAVPNEPPRERIEARELLEHELLEGLLRPTGTARRHHGRVCRTCPLVGWTSQPPFSLHRCRPAINRPRIRPFRVKEVNGDGDHHS